MAKKTKTTKKPKQDEINSIEATTEDDKRIAEIYTAMKEYYGDNLANFEHHPRVMLISIACFSTTDRKGHNNESSILIRHSP